MSHDLIDAIRTAATDMAWELTEDIRTDDMTDETFDTAFDMFFEESLIALLSDINTELGK